GLNGKIMNGWKKNVKNLISTLEKIGFHVVIPKNFVDPGSGNLQIRKKLLFHFLCTYLRTGGSKKFEINESIEIEEMSSIERYRYADFISNRYTYDGKVIPLSKFVNTNDNIEKGKIVKIIKYDCSQVVMTRIVNIITIPFDIWNYHIFTFLENVDIINFYKAFVQN